MTYQKAWESFLDALTLGCCDRKGQREHLERAFREAAKSGGEEMAEGEGEGAANPIRG